jgi:hypothetical protein
MVGCGGVETNGDGEDTDVEENVTGFEAKTGCELTSCFSDSGFVETLIANIPRRNHMCCGLSVTYQLPLR